ncbi:MAG: response regulator [Opitutaceae bacterium]|nr:response regulator [Opitutaceae bacterium]
MRILILEDERATAQLLGMLLTTSGHTIVHAVDGNEGLKQLRAAPCDLVISDVQMVPMDGFQFLSVVRDEFPRLLVVLASACSDLHARVESQPHKPFDVVHKPFRIEEIRRVLNRAAEALNVQAGIAQASTAGASASPSDSTASINNALAALFPGIAFAATRSKLARMMRQPGNALVVAEPGLICPDSLQLWREASPNPGASWQVLDAKNCDTDTKAALFGEDGLPGPITLAARGGTLVLLNLDSLPASDQAKLTGLLQGTPPTRMIATVRRDPDLLLEEGLIDESLYFRFSTSAISIPALCDLVEHIDAIFTDVLRASPDFPFASMDLQIESAASAAIRGYRWPDNLSELRAVADWTATQMRSPRVVLSHLPERFRGIHIETLADALARAQREHLQRAIRVTPSPAEAARALGVTHEDLTRALASNGPDLFSIGSEAVQRTEGAPAASVGTRTRNGFLIIAADDRLRLPMEAHFAGISIDTRSAIDGLQAIARILLAPVRPRFVIICGPTPPFELPEFIAQLRRIEPSLTIATLGAETEIDGVSCFPSLDCMDKFASCVAHLLSARTPAPVSPPAAAAAVAVAVA